MVAQITPFDPFPQRQSDGVNFAPNADSYFRQQVTFVAQANQLVTEVNAAAVSVGNDKSSASSSAAIATQKATEASNSAAEAANALEACLAASNFQGVWSAVANYSTGETVIYNGALWMALQASTGSEPVSGSANWVSIYALTEKVDLPLPTLDLNFKGGVYRVKKGT